MVETEQMRLITTADQHAIDFFSLPVWAAQVAVPSAQALIAPRAKQLDAPVVLWEAAPIVPHHRDTLLVKASRMLGRALGPVTFLERCGEVYLVAFEPYRVPNADPILPIAIPILSPACEKAQAAYAKHIVGFYNHPKWHKKAVRLCDRVIGTLAACAQGLYAEELAYMVIKLQMALVWPQGEGIHNV